MSKEEQATQQPNFQNDHLTTNIAKSLGVRTFPGLLNGKIEYASSAILEPSAHFKASERDGNGPYAIPQCTTMCSTNPPYQMIGGAREPLLSLDLGLRSARFIKDACTDS
jgi:hypothetical protein